jgi:hypothetical protein
MKFNKLPALASLAFLFFAAPAQAELLQTWRLASTTYQVQSEFTPPSFAEIGQKFYIDYVIDTQASSMPGWDGMFMGAVKSFSVNGITSRSDGYIMGLDWLSAINVAPSSFRSDGITFVSFNNFAGMLAPDVSTALGRFSDFAHTPATDLRVDFGDNSIWARPSSFEMTSVPEPLPALLMLAGLPLLLLRNRRRASVPAASHAGASV